MAYKNGKYTSDAPEEKAQIGPMSPGKIMSCYALNLAGAKRYLWLFDAAPGATVPVLPSDANMIAGPFPLAADPGAINIDVGVDEVFAFINGLYAASSTSGSTYTPSTTADLRLTVMRTTIVRP